MISYKHSLKLIRLPADFILDSAIFHSRTWMDKMIPLVELATKNLVELLKGEFCRCVQRWASPETKKQNWVEFQAQTGSSILRNQFRFHSATRNGDSFSIPFQCHR